MVKKGRGWHGEPGRHRQAAMSGKASAGKRPKPKRITFKMETTRMQWYYDGHRMYGAYVNGRRVGSYSVEKARTVSGSSMSGGFVGGPTGSPNVGGVFGFNEWKRRVRREYGK